MFKKVKMWMVFFMRVYIYINIDFNIDIYIFINRYGCIIINWKLLK